MAKHKTSAAARAAAKKKGFKWPSLYGSMYAVKYDKKNKKRMGGSASDDYIYSSHLGVAQELKKTLGKLGLKNVVREYKGQTHEEGGIGIDSNLMPTYGGKTNRQMQMGGNAMTEVEVEDKEITIDYDALNLSDDEIALNTARQMIGEATKTNDRLREAATGFNDQMQMGGPIPTSTIMNMANQIGSSMYTIDPVNITATRPEPNPDDILARSIAALNKPTGSPQNMLDRNIPLAPSARALPVGNDVRAETTLSPGLTNLSSNNSSLPPLFPLDTSVSNNVRATSSAPASETQQGGNNLLAGIGTIKGADQLGAPGALAAGIAGQIGTMLPELFQGPERENPVYNRFNPKIRDLARRSRVNLDPLRRSTINQYNSQRANTRSQNVNTALDANTNAGFTKQMQELDLQQEIQDVQANQTLANALAQTGTEEANILRGNNIANMQNRAAYRSALKNFGAAGLEIAKFVNNLGVESKNLETANDLLRLAYSNIKVSAGPGGGIDVSAMTEDHQKALEAVESGLGQMSADNREEEIRNKLPDGPLRKHLAQKFGIKL